MATASSSTRRARLAGLADLASSLLDFVYPPLCLVCDAPLPRGEALVCGGCWAEALRPRRRPAPPLVGRVPVHAPLAAGPTLFAILHEAKYRGRRALLGRLAAVLAEHVASEPALRDAAAFIPVPLHDGRRRERGYNQSEALAAAAARAAGARLDARRLARLRDTRSQARLGPGARATNVRGAFRAARRASDGALAGRVVLVDDVVTSGATVLECVGALEAAGARDVHVLALVRA